ncbi:ribonuclease domain-containing protein [Nonomuraea sp. NPDC046570]|uniref:ribonuclease domain-containing protein n=1 Tax=Nonomuraea sp. NPDC046570 TaxID=3155255 RepID=UPI0033E53E2A
MFRRIAAILFAVVAFVGGTAAALPAQLAPPPTKALSALPPEAAQTWKLIQRGGPFPYRRDGTTFQNRERLLPQQKLGYYKEYTVPTPGSRDRGARRLVTGKGTELYYTGDHYRSFVTVDVKR